MIVIKNKEMEYCSLIALIIIKVNSKMINIMGKEN